MRAGKSATYATSSDVRASDPRHHDPGRRARAHVRLDLRPMPVSFDDACKRFGNASASVVELV
jgi:hypothetical protein